MGGAIPLLPVYAFVALTGTSLPLSTANECFFMHTKCSECPELFYLFMKPESLQNLWPRSLFRAESQQYCYLYNMIE